MAVRQAHEYCAERKVRDFHRSDHRSLENQAVEMIRRPDSLGVVGFRSRSWHGTAITPRPAIKGVMVSSTFKDLEEHRAELIKALHRQKLFAIEIEDRSSKPDDDVIPSLRPAL